MNKAGAFERFLKYHECDISYKGVGGRGGREVVGDDVVQACVKYIVTGPEKTSLIYTK